MHLALGCTLNQRFHRCIDTCSIANMVMEFVSE